MVDDRIAARRAEVRQDHRRRRLRRTILVATLLLVGLAAWAIERSSLVALAEVRVTGVERLEEDVVRTAAALEPGTSTLRLDLSGARDRVEALPLVLRATVRRVDPLTVAVDVTERVPVAVVTRRGDAVLVDADGVILAPGREVGLPVIDLVAGRLPQAGGHVSDHPAIGNAHAALQQLPGALRARVASYVAAGPDDVDLVLDDGVIAHLGRADRIDEKARALGAMLEDLQGRAVEAIDVRAPSRPVVVPAS